MNIGRILSSGTESSYSRYYQICVCKVAGLSTYLEPDEGAAFETEKETMTAEGLIKIIYAFLKTS